MLYTTDELRQIAKSKEPHGWGKKYQALLYAADVIDSGQALIDDQKAAIDAKYKEIEALINRTCKWVKCKNEGTVTIDYDWYETKCQSAHKALTKFCPSCGGKVIK